MTLENRIDVDLLNVERCPAETEINVPWIAKPPSSDWENVNTLDHGNASRNEDTHLEMRSTP